MEEEEEVPQSIAGQNCKNNVCQRSETLYKWYNNVKCKMELEKGFLCVISLCSKCVHSFSTVYPLIATRSCACQYFLNHSFFQLSMN